MALLPPVQLTGASHPWLLSLSGEPDATFAEVTRLVSNGSLFLYGPQIGFKDYTSDGLNVLASDLLAMGLSHYIVMFGPGYHSFTAPIQFNNSNCAFIGVGKPTLTHNTLDSATHSSIIRFNGSDCVAGGFTVDGREVTSSSTGYGIHITAPRFRLSDVWVRDTKSASATNGSGIVATHPDIILDNVLVENATYAGMILSDTEGLVIQNCEVRNCARALNFQGLVPLNRMIVNGFKGLATLPGKSAFVNFNRAANTKHVSLTDFHLEDRDQILPGVSYDVNFQPEMMKAQDIDLLEMNDFSLLNGINQYTPNGSQLSFRLESTLQQKVRKIHMSNGVMSGSISFAGHKPDEWLIDKCVIGRDHAVTGSHILYHMAKRTKITNSEIFTHNSGYCLYTIAGVAGSSSSPVYKINFDYDVATLAQMLALTGVATNALCRVAETQSAWYFIGGSPALIDNWSQVDCLLPTDTLEMTDNEIIANKSSGTTYLVTESIKYMAGRVIFAANNWRQLGAAAILPSNKATSTMTISTDRNGDILWDEDIAAAGDFAGYHLAAGAGPNYFSTLPCPAKDGVRIRNIRYGNGTTATWRELISAGGNWKAFL